MEWISIEEDSPGIETENLSKTILVSDGLHQDVGHYNHEHKKYICYNSYGYMYDVTHWMHLPNLPN